MTHEILILLLRKKYVQKDLEKREKQVKKNDGKTSNDGVARTGCLHLLAFIKCCWVAKYSEKPLYKKLMPKQIFSRELKKVCSPQIMGQF